MGEPESRLAAASFTSEELVKLFAATYLPLCELLEREGVVPRDKIAKAMSCYVQPNEASGSASMVAALQIALRQPLSDAVDDAESSDQRGRVAMKVINGGLSRTRD